MWIDDVISLRNDYFRAINDIGKVSKEILRTAWSTKPELYWSDEVREFARKYNLDSALGSSDRYAIGQIAAGRMELEDIRDYLVPKSPEREEIVKELYNNFCFDGSLLIRRDYVNMHGVLSQDINPADKKDLYNIADVLLKASQQLYVSDRDVYKELYEQFKEKVKDNINDATAIIQKECGPDIAFRVIEVLTKGINLQNL